MYIIIDMVVSWKKTASVIIFVITVLTIQCFAKGNDYLDMEDAADSFSNLSGNEEVSPFIYHIYFFFFFPKIIYIIFSDYCVKFATI